MGPKLAAEPVATGTPASGRQQALLITGGYLVAAALWILLSDMAVDALDLGPRAQIANGLLFVLATAALLYLLLRRELHRDARRQRALDSMARAYRLLFERHPLPSWVCDPDSRVVLAANAAATALHGGAGSVVGRALPEALGREPDDDSTLVRAQDDGRERHYRLLQAPCTFDDRPAVIYLATEMTEERVALARAHRYSEEMKLLTRRLLNAQERERRNIARQLHDQLGQTLTVARLLVENTLDQIDDEDGRATLQEAMHALESGLRETRELTAILRPPMLDDLGLIPTLRWFVDRETQDSPVRVVMDMPSDPGGRTPEIEVAAYRIAQEAVDNALRHGSPSVIRLRLRLRKRVLTLSVEDDGRGFDPERVLTGLIPFGRSGLLGARERAESLGGGMRVRSQPGRGTIVRTILPRTPREG